MEKKSKYDDDLSSLGESRTSEESRGSFVLEESKLANNSSLSLIEILPVRRWVGRTLGTDTLQRSTNHLSSLSASYSKKARMTTEEQLQEPVSIVVGDKLSIVNLLAEKMLNIDDAPPLLSSQRESNHRRTPERPVSCPKEDIQREDVDFTTVQLPNAVPK
jgi:hypothetical protein